MIRIEVLELWTIRELLCFSWVDHMTKEEVLRRAGTERELQQIIKQRKVSYLRQIIRSDKYEVLSLVLMCKIGESRDPWRK